MKSKRTTGKPPVKPALSGASYTPPLTIAFGSSGEEVKFIRKDGAGNYWYEYTKSKTKKIGSTVWFTEDTLKRTTYWNEVTKNIKPSKATE